MKLMVVKLLSKVEKSSKVLYEFISSWLGMKIALRSSVRQAPTIWQQDLAGRRVLVVGTGPSLDHVGKDYFSDFDVLVCVNHAILQTPAHHCRYYFSTDVPRTREVMATQAAAQIETLPIERRILFLSFARMAPYLVFGFLSRFTVARHRIYVPNRKLKHLVVNTYFHPKRSMDMEIVKWIQGEGQLEDMPSMGGSSAFGAILLAARYRPTEIRLIGVDLSDGRAKTLQGVAGEARFSGTPRLDSYRRLEGLVRKCGISIENDSVKIRRLGKAPSS